VDVADGQSAQDAPAGACWRGPYLNHWPSAPGTYEFDSPGGTTTAVVRIHSVPVDSFPTVAAQISAVFGPSAVVRYAAGAGWSAEIPVILAVN
jgi:hypothetical protein